jgi:hypothetical protein
MNATSNKTSPIAALRIHLIKQLSRGAARPGEPTSSETSVSATTVEDLIALETEYDKYTRTIQTLIWGSALVLGLVGLVMTLSVWANGRATAVPLLLAHINGDDALAAFGILAAIVLALQIITRTPPMQQPDREFEARKRVMSLLAVFLVIISLGLGVYLAVQNTAAATFATFDPVRSFGPVVGGFILALLAADAASADVRSREFETRHAQMVLSAMRLREQETSLQAGVRRSLRRRDRVFDIALLVVIPVLIVLVLNLSVGSRDGGQVIVSALLISGYCAAIYGVVYETFVTASRGTWSFIEASFVMPVFVFLVFGLSIAFAIIESSTAESWAARTAGGLLWFFAVTAVPAALAWFLTRAGGEKARRGLLRDIAVSRVASQLRTVEDRMARTTSTIAWNKVAIASFVISPLFPFGAILGMVARRQIVLAKREGSSQRGSRLAAAAIVVSCCVPVLLIAGLLAIVIANPS